MKKRYICIFRGRETRHTAKAGKPATVDRRVNPEF